MASLQRTYKNNIVEGRGFLVFSILLALVFRIVYLYNFEELNITTYPDSGYFWQLVAPLFGNSLVSAIVSMLFTAGIAFYAVHINTKHVLIRDRTIFPAATVILLFSCHPSFIFMSSYYISAFLFMFITDMVFSAYHEGNAQGRVFGASFMLALASLFTPVTLIFLPVLWLAFIIMGCFNLKSVIASLLGVFVLYFPVFSYYFLFDSIDAFRQPLMVFNVEALKQPFLLSFTFNEWFIFAFSFVLLIVMTSDNYVGRHKDKIKTRAMLNMLNTVLIMTILAVLFLNISPVMNIYLAFISGGLLLSHYYALAEKSTTVIFFFCSVILYILICFMPFSSI